MNNLSGVQEFYALAKLVQNEPMMGVFQNFLAKLAISYPIAL